MKLKLTASSRSPSSVRVWLGETDITSICSGVEIAFAMDDVNSAVLRISPTELDVDAEVIAMLQARLNESVSPG